MDDIKEFVNGMMQNYYEGYFVDSQTFEECMKDCLLAYTDYLEGGVSLKNALESIKISDEGY
ncbi:MAG: hypothetical protein CMF22_10365 [Idiomarinaceae bacterium]|nr:hypothetical protein [Idiomarinaceae bacterium]MBG23844.1 hypothetical protein [Idiomarinaceae bacterium]|tara:strand:+ start:22749 stop:22934 length:186 start_codon:yes stop_codon:yes gene_type:complete